MVKPSFQQDQSKPALKAQNWLSIRWLKRPDLKQPVVKQPVVKQPAAKMPVEKLHEAAIPLAERDTLSSHPPQLPQPPEPFPTPPRQWQWPLVWFSAFAVLGGMGTAALVWLISLPPQIDCRHPERLSLDMERLYCAQEAAQSGEMTKLIAGIDFLKQWQPDHPLHGEAQRLIKEWSDQVLTLSTRRVASGDLKGAESALSHIPASTPVYQDARKALTRWRKYSQRASKLNAKAQAALKQKDWHAVSDYIVLLAAFERDYWSLDNGADALAHRLGVEKQAWQALGRAQKLAANPQQLAAAIPLAQQVPDQTYAAAAAKVSLKQWSQKLVATGNQQWQKGNRLGAIATLQLDPKVVNQPEIEELYRFSNAYKLANPALSERWLPTASSLLNLAEAIAAVAHVKSDSPFHRQAQALQKSWQAQMQNLVQLKYASAAASFEHPALLALAVDQAGQISAAEPRRLQAQTLIAYWQQETERIEDQPIVNRAMELAKGGTVSAFQAAIVEVSQIDLSRALRQQSQTLIATWRSQIQTLEDRPRLEQANDLAQKGQLDRAIQTASQIRTGRALYREAQAAIADWRYQQVVASQIAQDQPILDQALAQAATGQLSSAITTASRIGSGRALSSRAQASIQQWSTQLNPPVPPSAPYTLDSIPIDPAPVESPLDGNQTPYGSYDGQSDGQSDLMGNLANLPLRPRPMAARRLCCLLKFRQCHLPVHTSPTIRTETPVQPPQSRRLSAKNFLPPRPLIRCRPLIHCRPDRRFRAAFLARYHTMRCQGRLPRLAFALPSS